MDGRYTSIKSVKGYSQALIISYVQVNVDIDGLMQDCSNSIADALELLQSCSKPLTSLLINVPQVRACVYVGPLLLTWFNLIPVIIAIISMGWNYLSIPKLQQLHCWSLGMDK